MTNLDDLLGGMKPQCYAEAKQLFVEKQASEAPSPCKLLIFQYIYRCAGYEVNNFTAKEMQPPHKTNIPTSVTIRNTRA